MAKSEYVRAPEHTGGKAIGMEPLLTVDEVALFFRVQPSTVRKWAREKKIPQAIKCGNSWRFHKSVLEERLPVYNVPQPSEE